MAKKNELTYTCLCCSYDLVESEFPKSASYLNQKTGRLPYCKGCCSEFYDRLLVEQQDEMKALYKFCMQLDIYFDRDLANTLAANKNATSNLGFRYINKMGLVQYRKKTFSDTKCFINVFPISEDELEEIMYINVEKNKEDILREAKNAITPEIIGRWGTGFEYEEYMFLEERYQICLDTYENNNPASLWDYQEMCINYLELRKNRGNYQAQQKLQEMIDRLQKGCKMKIAQLDNTEDDNASFGRFIDRIEMFEPCDKRLSFFEDIDNIRKYIKKWFCLPFARELEIMDEKEINEILEGENIDDYSDINKIYQEQQEKHLEDSENDREDREDREE